MIPPLRSLDYGSYDVNAPRSGSPGLCALGISQRPVLELFDRGAGGGLDEPEPKASKLEQTYSNC